VAIDGVKTDGLGLTEAMDKLRGPEMTATGLTIRRSGKQFAVRLARQKLPAVERSVQAEIRQWRGQRIGYVRLDLFLATSIEQVREAVRKLEEERAVGLLLDLRNNPGGDVRSCLQIAGLFLGDDPLANVNGRDGVKPLRALGEQVTKLPMNVLVNKGTASAGELLAVGLQANQRAVVVGQTTFGKGLVHRAAPLSDGSMVLMTSGSLRTLRGAEILGGGITPDVVVNTRAGRDEQWNKAADLLLRRPPDLSSGAKKRFRQSPYGAKN
jgi:carboxyl-terminal processing protease